MYRRYARIACIGLTSAALGGCHDSSTPTAIQPTAQELRVSATVCKPPLPDDQIPLPIAPSNKRVDLAPAVFTNPTRVTNPLFPIANLAHTVLVGFVDGERFRAETTLLPETKTIDLGGVKVETLVSQYVGYVDGRIHETALDWYAQADDGSAWYLGEDVSNYEDGEVADKDGSWIACKDGPAAMIMPAQPRVGDVFRVENIYPFVFEEVEVKAIGLTFAGPLGPVAGGITVQQLHLDGHYEPKDFAPGYGEFSTGSSTDVEALALAIPTDAASGGTPTDLETLLDGAVEVFDAAADDKWPKASRALAQMTAAWPRYAATGAVPRLLEPLITEALQHLGAAIQQQDSEEAMQAAIEVERSGLDVLVRYEARTEVDFDRMEMFGRQLVLDAEGEDRGGVVGDLAVLDIILDRLVGTDAGDPREIRRLRRLIADVRVALERKDFKTALARARRLHAALTDDGHE